MQKAAWPIAALAASIFLGGCATADKAVVTVHSSDGAANSRGTDFQPVNQHGSGTGFQPVNQHGQDGRATARDPFGITNHTAEQVEYATALAEKGALHSARDEFVTCLGFVAQARDAASGTTDHDRALGSGLLALKEADDFVLGRPDPANQHYVAQLIARHTTPVLKQADVAGLTPFAALQQYYLYAEQQLAAACDHDPLASETLASLGRVTQLLEQQSSGGIPRAVPKAIAFYRAALWVNPLNYVAANELAVLLAKCGQLADAEALFKQSIAVNPRPESYHNLAQVYARLGNRLGEEEAMEMYRRLTAPAKPGGQSPTPDTADLPRPEVQWVDPAVFAQDHRPDSLGGAVAPESPAQTNASASAAKPENSGWLANLLPWQSPKDTKQK